MFNETSFSGLRDLGVVPSGWETTGEEIVPRRMPRGIGLPTRPTGSLWEALGFGSKYDWKRAGKPRTAAGWADTGEEPTPRRMPGAGQLPGTGPGGSREGEDGAASKGGAADFFSSIPSSWLLIGGAVILLMVLKK